MENNKQRILRVFTGVLGVILIILSLILFASKSTGETFKAAITTLLQLDLGLLLLVYGINENRTKGKPKGNSYFVVGLAVLTSTLYTIYNLYSKLAQ